MTETNPPHAALRALATVLEVVMLGGIAGMICLGGVAFSTHRGTGLILLGMPLIGAPTALVAFILLYLTVTSPHVFYAWEAQAVKIVTAGIVVLGGAGFLLG